MGRRGNEDPGNRDRLNRQGPVQLRPSLFQDTKGERCITATSGTYRKQVVESIPYSAKLGDHGNVLAQSLAGTKRNQSYFSTESLPVQMYSGFRLRLGQFSFKGEKMTRKDYQKVAAVLAKYRDGHMRLTDNVISDIAIDLAAMFTEDNSNFQQSLFFRAVLTEGE